MRSERGRCSNSWSSAAVDGIPRGALRKEKFRPREAGRFVLRRRPSTVIREQERKRNGEAEWARGGEAPPYDRAWNSLCVARDRIRGKRSRVLRGENHDGFWR